jgi:hypothetical protein
VVYEVGPQLLAGLALQQLQPLDVAEAAQLQPGREHVREVFVIPVGHREGADLADIGRAIARSRTGTRRTCQTQGCGGCGRRLVNLRVQGKVVIISSAVSGLFS